MKCYFRFVRDLNLISKRKYNIYYVIFIGWNRIYNFQKLLSGNTLAKASSATQVQLKYLRNVTLIITKYPFNYININALLPPLCVIITQTETRAAR